MIDPGNLPGAPHPAADGDNFVDRQLTGGGDNFIDPQHESNVAVGNATSQARPFQRETPANSIYQTLLAMKGSIIVGGRLKALRTQKEISAAVVAEAVGISRPHLTNIENGKRTAGRQTFVALADFYAVSLDWLVSPDGHMEDGAGRVANNNEALLLQAFRRLPSDEADVLLKLILGRVRPPGN